jgi:hypothetical protein
MLNYQRVTILCGTDQRLIPHIFLVEPGEYSVKRLHLSARRAHALSLGVAKMAWRLGQGDTTEAQGKLYL